MNCLHCNQPIVSKRKTKKYCSNTCKQYAYLHRTTVVPPAIDKNEKVEPIINEDNYDYEEQPVITEPKSGYKKIRPKILSMLDHPPFNLEKYLEYFSTRIGGRIRPENFRSFGYVCKRIRCIIENLFMLSYKIKVHFNTVHFLRKALEETLTSDHMKYLPADFPFGELFLDLYKQLGELEKLLKENKEGIKFTLEKSKVVVYANVLRIVREFAAFRTPFSGLFPHLFKG
ncbi:MAG: hypothetical protein ACOZCO_07315 [Bacteroidota bacterium]